MSGYSDQLSRALRDEFPNLTIRRLDELWAMMLQMPRGEVAWSITDPDLVCPYELVAILHLARELAYRDRDELAKVIKRLSARKKRVAFPKSYAVEETNPAT
jgi:hypothetical protein